MDMTEGIIRLSWNTFLAVVVALALAFAGYNLKQISDLSTSIADMRENKLSKTEYLQNHLKLENDLRTEVKENIALLRNDLKEIKEGNQTTQSLVLTHMQETIKNERGRGGN